jgi:catechol 2,3-dioxygenase-like lactoylglutathione lyase family enzyme
MHPVATDLDHVGTIVPNLDRAQQTFENLGFKLTPRSHHQGAVVPGGPIVPWGQANHCAMLKQGYLEVLGIVDSTKPTPAAALLARYEGPHIVAFRPSSAEAVQALTDAGQAIDPVRHLERQTAFGPEGNQTKRVAFRNMRFTTSRFNEAQFQYTEHLTRDVMWQPHLTEHPNGVVALDCVYLCSPDPRATADKLSPVLGIEPVAGRPGERVFKFEASSLCVLTPEAWASRAPSSPLPLLPAPVGYALRTSSLPKTAEVLQRNGVPFDRIDAGVLRVGTVHACGNVITFTEGPAS